MARPEPPLLCYPLTHHLQFVSWGRARSRAVIGEGKRGRPGELPRRSSFVGDALSRRRR